MGRENIDVARVMMKRRGLNRESITTGTSVHHQCIERLWHEVNRIVYSRFVNVFSYLERNGLFHPLSDIHLWSLHVVYLPLINKALQDLISSWNHPPVTTECNYSPRQLWIDGMLRMRNHIYSPYRMYCKAVTNLIYSIIMASMKKGLCQVYKQQCGGSGKWISAK